MAGIENKETPSTQVGAPFRIKKIIGASALAAATLFNSCGNDHTIKDLQDTTGIEQKDSTKYYCELVDLTQVIKEGEDGNKYVDDIYHYPIIEKDGKTYLIYNNTEYELKICQRINDNNYEFYTYGLKNGGDLYYLADGEIHKGEIISDMGITTDGKNYFKVTDFETQKETFVFNGKKVANLDHILKVYWDGSRRSKLLLVIGNNYDKEGDIKYKLIIDGKEYDIDSPYEKVNLDLRGKFLEEGVSLAFYENLLELVKGETPME